MIAVGPKRPPLIGSRWERKTPECDAWDLVDVVGVYELSEVAGGGLELCIRTVEFTTDPVGLSDGEDFVRHYRRIDAEDPADDLTRRLMDLGGWA